MKSLWHQFGAKTGSRAACLPDATRDKREPEPTYPTIVPPPSFKNIFKYLKLATKLWPSNKAVLNEQTRRKCPCQSLVDFCVLCFVIVVVVDR